MLISHARNHFQRHSAETSKAAESETPRDANGYELMLMKLAQDKRRLHDIQSMETRAEVKREILPEYGPWIEGVLTGDQGVQDDVVMTAMVWRIDAGDYMGALEIARYALKHKLSLPDKFSRTTATLIAEEMADAAIKAHDNGVGFNVEPLQVAEEITAGEDMPDQVRAKLCKAIGYSLNVKTDSTVGIDLGLKQSALEFLKRAYTLFDKVGVKKDIEKLERELKNSTDASSGG